jgi:hypothetical protein
MTDDAIKKSVTRDDGQRVTQSGGFTVVVGPSTWGQFLGAGLLEGIKGATGLPPYGTKAADAILSETPMIENMWASALSTAISKQTSLGFEIEDTTESARRIKQAQELMLNLDGNYTSGLAKVLRDYLTTDNGGFIEIVRSSSAAGSKVVGLMHLDSLRCYRTGDPKFPLIYVDMRGRQHVMRADDVLMFADTPSPRTEHYGMGISAARRAFETILKLTAIETYVREKVSGRRNLAIHIVNGITSDQLGQALNSSAAMQDQKGYVVYNGSTIIPMIRNETPSIATIPLAEIPDGFDANTERSDAYLRYANALGIFVGEIQPLSGQGLGTGTQTVVLEEAAEGRGLAGFRKQFAHAITHQVFPSAVTFHFAVSDQKDRKAKADTLSAWAGALKPLVEMQVISPAQALNVLVDDGYLPREFLATDETAGGVVTDSENVETTAQAAQIADQAQAEAQAQTSAEAQATAQAPTDAEKALVRLKQTVQALGSDADLFYQGDPPTGRAPTGSELDRMIDDELKSALRLLEKLTS